MLDKMFTFSFFLKKLFFVSAGVFIAVHELSQVVAGGGYSLVAVCGLHCGGFSCCRAQALGRLGFSSCSSCAAMPPGLQDLFNEELNLCALH